MCFYKYIPVILIQYHVKETFRSGLLGKYNPEDCCLIKGKQGTNKHYKSHLYEGIFKKCRCVKIYRLILSPAPGLFGL
jgi:hypothetical protein